MVRPMTPARALLATALLLALAGPARAGNLDHERPKLVVVLVVDQMRADYLGRFADRLLPAVGPDGRPGGFRRVIDQGAYWPVARHDVYQAMTGPGHASIATGAWPARSGITLNNWWQGESFMYCVGDPSATNLPDDGTGKDRSIGLANLVAPTLGDTLKSHPVGGSVVSISLKDRAAALLGGHRADTVLWFDSKALRWTTSTYWTEELPAWVAELNTGPRGGQDLFLTHGGNDAVVEAALAAVDAQSMGRDDRPDLLLLGLSALDYLGHEVGPDAPEVGDMIVSVDAALAALFAGLEQRLGSLDEVVLAVTADHGAPRVPEVMAEEGLPAGRILEPATEQELEALLVGALGAPAGASWIGGMYRGNVWFRADSVADPATRHAAEEAVRAALLELPGVDEVLTASDLDAGRFPPGPPGERLANQYRSGRSADVIAGMRPLWISTSYTYGVSHMTRYAYDTTVPLAIAGPGIGSGRHATPATVIDLAPTLAWLLDILPPASAEGRVLSEALSPPALDSSSEAGSGRAPRKRSRRGTP